METKKDPVSSETATTKENWFWKMCRWFFLVVCSGCVTLWVKDYVQERKPLEYSVSAGYPVISFPEELKALTVFWKTNLIKEPIFCKQIEVYNRSGYDMENVDLLIDCDTNRILQRFIWISPPNAVHAIDFTPEFYGLKIKLLKSRYDSLGVSLKLFYTGKEPFKVDVSVNAPRVELESLSSWKIWRETGVVAFVVGLPLIVIAFVIAMYVLNKLTQPFVKWAWKIQADFFIIKFREELKRNLVMAEDDEKSVCDAALPPLKSVVTTDLFTLRAFVKKRKAASVASAKPAKIEKVGP